MNKLIVVALMIIALSIAGCDNQPSTSAVANEHTKPAFFVDKLTRQHYDGISDDLATAGLGLDGLRRPPPTFVDPLRPTPEELRRSAIYHNYNHLLTLNPADGYGQLMGMELASRTKGIAGYEYLLPVRYSDQSIAAVHMVQVPDEFDPLNPCIVAAPSSGSRGIYGAIGVVGAWALAQKCAVAYTDKGTGTGFDWLTADTQQTVTGMLTQSAAEDGHFAVKRGKALTHFTETFPHRVATKHAHSQHLPDKDWGTFVLQAVQLALYVLNEYHTPEQTLTRDNTWVLAAGISNGGAAALRAGEADTDGWIDAVVASEPAINLPEGYRYTLQANGEAKSIVARDLLDQATLSALLLPCAVLAIEQPLMGEALMPLWKSRLEKRCALLQRADLVEGKNTIEHAHSALMQLHKHGMQAEAEPLALLSVSIYLWEAVAVNYANSYGRFGVNEHLCNISYAYVNAQGDPVATPLAVMAGLFGVGNGIVPTGGITLINDISQPSPKMLLHSKNAQGEDDIAFTNLRCLRDAWQSKVVQQGLAQTRVSGDLQGKPAIIVHGHSDNLIHVNSNSRPYLVLNQEREGNKSKLHYYEVTHGQHFDNLLQIPTLRSHFIPLHVYFEQALNAMLAHLRNNEPLPPSQVVMAQPVANATQALTGTNLPAVAEEPKHPIVVNKRVLEMP